MNPDDIYERAAPWRIVSALEGDSTLPLSDVYLQIVAYLRSDKSLNDEVRRALADAIERGQTDADGVRLKIEAHGKHFRQITTRNSLRSLLEAAAWIVTEHELGATYANIYAKLPQKFPSINDGTDYGRRARELFKKFVIFAKSNDPAVVAVEGECPIDFERNPLSDDDNYFVWAAMRFCELESGMIES